MKWDLKSALSIITALVFAIMACTERLDQTFVQNIILLVFTFFFSHQVSKKSGGKP